MDEVRNRVTLPVNPEEHTDKFDAFINWYINAKAHDKFVYYHGTSLHETLASTYVKNLAWDYACEGKVYLFATRDLQNKYDWFFIAQKASRVIPSLNPKRKETKNG